MPKIYFAKCNFQKFTFSSCFLWSPLNWRYKKRKNQNIFRPKEKKTLLMHLKICFYLIKGILRPILCLDIYIHIVAGHEKLCKIYFFQNVLAFIDLFHRYHYIRYFIYSDCKWRHVCTKKVFLYILLIWQENICVRVSFHKVTGPATLLKRDSNTDVLLSN